MIDFLLIAVFLTVSFKVSYDLMWFALAITRRMR